MTAGEIRMQVPPMVIWMADAAIREARKGILGRTLSRGIKAPQNRPEVKTAAEVLFKMFQVCTADIVNALVNMDDDYNGYTLPTEGCQNYFNAFVGELQAVLGNGELRLRQPDWVLDRR